MRKGLVCLAIGVAVLLAPPSPVLAQDHGSGGGGGCGDVFGDLIHIKRADTGQPILARRWIELPKEEPGYGWGYCKIAVDASGNELGFADLSCDVAEEDLARVVEVNYFGRLNGGRTKERNNRMHFNEVLSSIKEAGLVKQGPAGRLTLGYDCDPNNGDETKCAEWSTVDSPMESMGLYSRLMKYGHLQTNPFEVDEWHHGDPKLPVQLQPALGPEDYAKFHTSVRELLPNDGATPWACFDDVNSSGEWDPTEDFTDLETDLHPLNGQYDDDEPFMDINANGEWDDGGDTFICGEPLPSGALDVVREDLDDRDFARAGSFLGAAANKFGKSTPDLVQYVNRILKITKKTLHSQATLATLPALVRDCPVLEEPDPDAEPQTEPVYESPCQEYEAYLELEHYALFPDVQEQFVDFAAAAYARYDWREEEVEIIRPESDVSWVQDKAWLTDWLSYANGPAPGAPLTDIDAFVKATGDGIRSIQFIHNYVIPDELWVPWGETQASVETVKVKDKVK